MNKALSNAEKFERVSKGSPFFAWLMEMIISHPEWFIAVFNLLGKLIKFALGHFVKDGKPVTPWWVKLLGAVGIKPMKELKAICTEACDVSESIDIPKHL